MVKVGQLVEFEEGVIVGIESMLSKQMDIIAFQLLEGHHRNQELIRLFYSNVVTALLIDFVLKLKWLRLALFGDAEFFIFRSASEVEVEKIELPSKNKM